jgi:hypothetical protein
MVKQCSGADAPGSVAIAGRPSPRIDCQGAGCGDHMEVLLGLVSGAIVIFPLWRITRRTGRDPWLSLLFLGTPPIGTIVFIAILAFGRWPAESASAQPKPDDTDGR